MSRRMSLRAQAQQIYRQMKEKRGASEAPAQSGGGDLTAQARALYEGSAVPVAEIARLAGVTERTIYKYARKGGWTPRYRWNEGDGARARRWRAGKAVAPVKGAGGRFIARADKGKPVATGIAAAHPARASRAGKACAKAAAIGAAAEAEAARAKRHEAQVRATDAIARALADFTRDRDGEDRRPQTPLESRVESVLLSVIEAQVARWEALLRET